MIVTKLCHSLEHEWFAWMNVCLLKELAVCKFVDKQMG